MTARSDLTVWDNKIEPGVPADINGINEIASYATQLSDREKQQICMAYNSGAYEIVAPFLWEKSISTLKREIGKLGVVFVAEMLNKSGVTSDSDVNDVINAREAIALAEELGMFTKTDAMRWRNNLKVVNHFTQRESREDSTPMEQAEAVLLLKTSVSNILSRQSIYVAEPFVKFRESLENKTIQQGDSDCNNLLSSPYFFRRLSLNIMLSGIRVKSGAQLDHLLANLNTLLPLLWPNFFDSEKWAVGNTYYELYGNGIQMATQAEGVKKALLKVRGFDYVKEALRSQTFVKTAQAIINAHEGMNNFYTETMPVAELEKLGSVFPVPALGKCITALLCVSLGNFYGCSFSAKPIADRMLRAISKDRWLYYFNSILPGDTRILEKFGYPNPLNQWIESKSNYYDSSMAIKQETNTIVTSNNRQIIEKAAEKCLENYYKQSIKK